MLLWSLSLLIFVSLRETQKTSDDQFVLVRVSIPAQNVMIKQQVGEERVFSAYTFHIALRHQRKSGLELKQVRKQKLIDAEAMEGCSLLACFPWLAQPAIL